MPKHTDIKKILIIGSGSIVIGRACEPLRAACASLFDQFTDMMKEHAR
ncbi:MAG TPA: hypothetical protein VFF95_01555 [Candidatus Binatus sp.]|jgi:hypothetical protein|nr:hypothetical protein [Candidatus Binatus sp.]